MSLQSTLESIDQSISPSSSQQQQIYVTTTSVRNQHLSLAQMRGVIQIFNHYFPKNIKKRMSRDEKNRKWISYKNRIYQEYKRIITGKFSSEKALVKRYSEPLAFLKYKLKRATNLNLNDLSTADREYYFEIGGLQDINELIKKTYNIDSIEKISNNFSNYNSNRKKRRRVDLSEEANNQSTHNDIQNSNQRENHNVRNSQQQIIGGSQLVQQISLDQQADNIMQLPPIVTQPKIEKDEKLTEALSFLNDKMDIFEREQLDKKKIEIFEMTKQKLLAVRQDIETNLINQPHLIGCLPEIEEQQSLAFDCWLNKHKNVIKDDAAIKGDTKHLIDQLVVLKMDGIEWKTFLARWKLNRIFSNDDFSVVWNRIKYDLSLTNDERGDENVNEFSDKIEMDHDLLGNSNVADVEDII